MVVIVIPIVEHRIQKKLSRGKGKYNYFNKLQACKSFLHIYFIVNFETILVGVRTPGSLFVSYFGS